MGPFLDAAQAEDLGLTPGQPPQRRPQPIAQFLSLDHLIRARRGRGKRIGIFEKSTGVPGTPAKPVDGPVRGRTLEQRRLIANRFAPRCLQDRQEYVLQALVRIMDMARQAICRPPDGRTMNSQHLLPVDQPGYPSVICADHRIRRSARAAPIQDAGPAWTLHTGRRKCHAGPTKSPRGPAAYVRRTRWSPFTDRGYPARV